MLLAIGFTLVAAANRGVAAGLLGTEAPYLMFIAAVLISAVVADRPGGALAAVDSTEAGLRARNGAAVH